MENNHMEAKHNRFNGHTWIVFIIMTLCITAIAAGVITALTLLVMKENDETTKDVEIAAIASTIYFAIKGFIVAGELLTGREITEKLETSKAP